MLENMTSALARIAQIKSSFRQNRAQGIVGIAPRTVNVPPSTTNTIRPFFPEYLREAARTATKGFTQEVSAYDDTIGSAASKYGLEPALLKAVVKAESDFNPTAVSRSGARGLMQLMPSTAEALGVSDPFDPAQSIEGGARYLRRQMDAFGDLREALAAYNAGPSAVVRHGGVPPFRETRNYVEKVLSLRDSYRNQE